MHGDLVLDGDPQKLRRVDLEIGYRRWNRSRYVDFISLRHDLEEDLLILSLLPANSISRSGWIVADPRTA